MNAFKSMLANMEDFLNAAAERYGEVYMAQARRHLADSTCKADRRAMYLL